MYAEWIKIKFKKHEQYLVMEGLIIQDPSKHISKLIPGNNPRTDNPTDSDGAAG